MSNFKTLPLIERLKPLWLVLLMLMAPVSHATYTAVVVVDEEEIVTVGGSDFYSFRVSLELEEGPGNLDSFTGQSIPFDLNTFELGAEWREAAMGPLTGVTVILLAPELSDTEGNRAYQSSNPMRAPGFAGLGLQAWVPSSQPSDALRGLVAFGAIPSAANIPDRGGLLRVPYDGNPYPLFRVRIPIINPAVPPAVTFPRGTGDDLKRNADPDAATGRPVNRGLFAGNPQGLPAFVRRPVPLRSLQPAARLAAGPVIVEEGGVAEVAVTLDRTNPTADTEINFDIVGVTDGFSTRTDIDFSASNFDSGTGDDGITTGTIVILAGQATTTIEIQISDNALDNVDGDKSFYVQFDEELLFGAVPTRTLVTIAAAVDVAFPGLGGATIPEGTTRTLTLVRSGGTPSQDVIVPLLVTPVAIQDDVEITAVVGFEGGRIIPVPNGLSGGEDGLFAFAAFTAINDAYAANATATFAIRATDDNLLEGAEEVRVAVGDPLLAAYDSVTLASRAGRVITRTASVLEATATIPANDPITVAVTPGRGQENGVGEGSDLRFTVTFSGNRPSSDISISMVIAGTGTVPTENADFDLTVSSDWTAAVANQIERETTIALADVVLGQPIALPTLRVAAGDMDDVEETFQLTVTPSRGAVGDVTGFDAFSPLEVVVPSTILRIDTEAPGLNGVGYATDDPTRRAWLRSGDPDLAILLPADAAAPAGSGEPSGAMLDGFSVMVMGGPNTRTVSAQAMYSSPNAIVLTLPEGEGLTAEDEGVYAIYEYPGSGLGIFDRSLEAGLRPADDQRRNQQRGPLMISLSAFSDTADSDGDGIPDAAEARLGGDPLSPGLPDGVPQVEVADGTRYFAYSGIRQYGGDAAMLRSHLGLTTTGTIASMTAYYLTDEASQPCYENSQFPASYAHAIAEGGCEPVDFLNMPAGVEHTIGWVVIGADAQGYWTVDPDTDSRLPVQTVYRVPELSMLTQRLFFTASAATTETVSVQAEHDGPTATGLMLGVTPQPGGIEAMVPVNGTLFTLDVSRSDVTTSSTAYWITGLSGGGASLWEPHSTDTAVRPSVNSYSLGLTPQTEVIVLPAGVALRPTLGTPLLTEGGEARSAVVLNRPYMLTIDTDAVSTPPPSAAFVGTSAGGQPPVAALSAGMLSVPFTATTAIDVVSLRVVVYGSAGSSSASAVYSWPVVDEDNVLADLIATDADDDGIPDGIDGLPNSDQLPVRVNDMPMGRAGEVPSHHLRRVLPQQLRVSLVTLAYVAALEATTPTYADYSASTGTGSNVEYSFEVYQVDYAADGDGGSSGLIIPLPRSLYDGEGEDGGWVPVKIGADGAERPFATSDADGGYGFAPLNPLGNCPDDTLDETSPYRDENGLKNAPKVPADACIAVWLVDGGANDEDGEINGIVRDPIGFVRRAVAVGGGGGSGGSVGLLSVALLMLVFAATLLRRRRARP